jgi:PhzF family phenazine biosynthesis protein
MILDLYQIDAFANEVFRGNPAGVICLTELPDDEILQNIAEENNLAETAFIVKTGGSYHIRWFTPTIEMDLCGHATLAAAYVMREYYQYNKKTITFNSKSGELSVIFDDPLLSMIFPRRPSTKCDMPDQLIKGLGVDSVVNTEKSRDFIVEFESEEKIKRLTPNIELLKIPDCLGIIVTSKGTNHDFVSRFFAPNAGIPEDPVTGSSHSTLIPYWSARLHKKKMRASQLSRRGGELFCEDLDDRVKISGRAVTYLIGKIYI